MEEKQQFLGGLWYVALLSNKLSKKKLTRIELCGQPFCFYRDKEDKVFAIHDICPHRGAPFSSGEVKETDKSVIFQCPYHGWQFCGNSGSCKKIPALCEKQRKENDITKISVFTLPVKEQNGVIWIFWSGLLGNKSNSKIKSIPSILPNLPFSQIIGEDGKQEKYLQKPLWAKSFVISTSFDEGVIGLIDPAHTPFVHKQIWWRQGKQAKLKQKNYRPFENGFVMLAHNPINNTRIYDAIGKDSKTEVFFVLPGIRLEHTSSKKGDYFGLTSFTPLDDNKVILHHMIYTNFVFAKIFRPILNFMASSFLQQDEAVLKVQNNNKYTRRTSLYMGDADMLAKWYLLLCKEWRHSEKNAKKFVNPIEATKLQWTT